jgi:subtilisin family serine protease
MTIRTAVRWREAAIVATLFVSLILHGCGSQWPPDPQSDNDEQTQDDANTGNAFTFDEDDDPLIAKLPFAETELLGRVFPGVTPDDLTDAYTDLNVSVIESIDEIQTVALRVNADAFNETAQTLSTHPLFESVSKSYFYDVQAIPDDEDFSLQRHFSSIGVDDAWDITTGSEDMIIAILDTGVEPNHPDLKDKLLDGWNVVDKNDIFDDVLGHGTAVAGSAAAVTDNGKGVAGVAWDNPILPVRVSDKSGRAASRDIATGIVWAVNNGAKVINVSFAPLGSDRTVLNAAKFARDSGALVFISTGNNGKSYRARQTDSAIFVGAVDDPDELAAFSNTGKFVDLVAPGTRIFTTNMGRKYGAVNGTSFASPIVAGVAALVWSVNPDLRPVTIEGILMDTADDLGARGRDSDFGVGRINAIEAIDWALDTVEDDDTRAPNVDIIEPADREVVSGVTKVVVAAFDANEVADVVLYVDGEAFATDTAEPFKIAVNTRRMTNGLHTIQVVATDRVGNARTSSTVRIIVEGGTSSSGTGGGSSGGSGSNDSNTSGIAQADGIPPTAMITSPADGSRVFSSVGVQGVAVDNQSLKTIEWLVDGARQDIQRVSGTRQTVTFLWNASNASSGQHIIVLRVTDDAGNQSSSSIRLPVEGARGDVVQRKSYWRNPRNAPTLFLDNGAHEVGVWGTVASIDAIDWNESENSARIGGWLGRNRPFTRFGCARLGLSFGVISGSRTVFSASLVCCRCDQPTGESARGSIRSAVHGSGRAGLSRYEAASAVVGRAIVSRIPFASQGPFA